MGLYYDAMTRDMGGKLAGYFESLQHRYGDPRVYAMQQEEMAERRGRAAHTKASTAAEALREAYKSKASKNRADHNKRMATKHQADHTASSHQQPVAPKGQRQTARPRKQP